QQVDALFPACPEDRAPVPTAEAPGLEAMKALIVAPAAAQPTDQASVPVAAAAGPGSTAPSQTDTDITVELVALAAAPEARVTAPSEKGPKPAHSTNVFLYLLLGALGLLV